MRGFIAYSLLVPVFFLSGCVMRTASYEMDRVDQELKGNRGIISGEIPHLPEIDRKKTRRMYELEVEIPSSLDAKKPKRIVPEKEDVKSSGFLQKPHVVYQEPVETGKKSKKEKEDNALIKNETGEKVYVVEKGDTLQVISQKIYGTTKKWKNIYEANKDVLETPDAIRPGEKLTIPMK